MDLELLFKASLCVMQLICLYHVIKHGRVWLVPLQMIMAAVELAI